VCFLSAALSDQRHQVVLGAPGPGGHWDPLGLTGHRGAWISWARARQPIAASIRTPKNLDPGQALGASSIAPAPVSTPGPGTSPVGGRRSYGDRPAQCKRSVGRLQGLCRWVSAIGCAAPESRVRGWVAIRIQGLHHPRHGRERGAPSVGTPAEGAALASEIDCPSHGPVVHASALAGAPTASKPLGQPPQSCA
jgi:hypothetical protein